VVAARIVRPYTRGLIAAPKYFATLLKTRGEMVVAVYTNKLSVLTTVPEFSLETEFCIIVTAGA